MIDQTVYDFGRTPRRTKAPMVAACDCKDRRNIYNAAPLMYQVPTKNGFCIYCGHWAPLTEETLVQQERSYSDHDIYKASVRLRGLGLKIKEIAKLLDTPENTIKKHCKRAGL